MPLDLPGISLPPALENARAVALSQGLPYAGHLTPLDAWQLASSGQAVLVDVRSLEERVFVGYVPGSVHVPWASGTKLTRNPRFVRELLAKLGSKDKVALLLCRSGKRSALAAAEAAKAGMPLVYGVLEGFEGELDSSAQRGHHNGWRAHGLPWVQD